MRQFALVFLLFTAPDGFAQTPRCPELFQVSTTRLKEISSSFVPWLLAGALVMAAPGEATSLSAVERMEIDRDIQPVAEGFYPIYPSAPWAVRRAWDSVFLIASYKNSATAFLIERRETQGETELYFLTSSHVVSTMCFADGICPDTFLFQSPVGSLQNGFVEILGESAYLKFSMVELISQATKWDLALVRVRTRLSPKFLPPPLRLSKQCAVNPGDRQFLIGMPMTFRRYPPQDPTQPLFLRFKQWSYGLVVPLSRPVHEGTTVDAMRGASGGPLLDTFGDVTGVMAATYNWHPVRFAFFSWLAKMPMLGIIDPSDTYGGDETPGHLLAHAGFISCKYVRKFLENAGLISSPTHSPAVSHLP